MFQFTQDMWDRFNVHNILKQNPHIKEQHVGKGKEYILNRAKRMKHNAATFFSYESVAMAAESFLYKMDIEKLIDKYIKFDEEFSVHVVCDEPIGIVAEADGKLFKVKQCKMVLRFHKNCIYRNEFTGMPFDVVTMYPIRAKEKTEYGHSS